MEVLSFEPARAAADEADDDRRLVASLRAGERQAAEELAARTYRTVYRTLYRLTGGDADLAADLTQDTYRRAWSGLAGFRGKARFSTWLYRIAYTTFLNHIRRPRPLVPADEELLERTEDPAPGADETLALDADAQRLRRAVLGLPEDLRYTVTARYWGGQSARDIGREQGVTAIAIRKRLRKALSLLSLALGEEEER